MKVVPPDTDDRFRDLGMPTAADSHFAETGTHKLEGDTSKRALASS